MNKNIYENKELFYQDEIVVEGIASSLAKAGYKGITGLAKNMVKRPVVVGVPAVIGGAAAYKKADDIYKNSDVSRANINPIDYVTGKDKYVVIDPNKKNPKLPGAGVARAITGVTGAGIDAVKRGAGLAGKTADYIDSRLDKALEPAPEPEPTLKDKALEKINSAKEKGKELKTDVETKASGLKDYVQNKYNQASPVKKGIGGALAGAALVGAGALIANALKKQDMYNTGCENLRDSDKKLKCQRYVLKRTINELKSKFGECKYSNNILKCQDEIRAAISEKQAELDNLK